MAYIQYFTYSKQHIMMLPYVLITHLNTPYLITYTR